MYPTANTNIRSLFAQKSSLGDVITVCSISRENGPTTLRVTGFLQYSEDVL